MTPLSFFIFILLQLKYNLASGSIAEGARATKMACDIREETLGTNTVSSCHTAMDVSNQPRIVNNCHLWDDQCMTAFAQRVAPSLMQRISESGLPIEPLYVDLIEVRAQGLTFAKKKVNVYGIKNIAVDSISFDTKANISRLIFHTNLYVSGRYEAKGNILSIPIFGDGNFRILMKNVEIEIIFLYNVSKNSNNEDVAEIKDYLLRYDVKTDAEMEFENLYDINKDSCGLHLFLNKYWKLVTEIYDPKTFDAMVGSLVEVVRDYLKTVPISSLAEF